MPSQFWAHSNSGLVPALMNPHTPSAPCCFTAALHERQRPSHVSAQQIPSTQNPLAHSALLLQDSPDFFLHTHQLGQVELVAQRVHPLRRFAIGHRQHDCHAFCLGQ